MHAYLQIYILDMQIRMFALTRLSKFLKAGFPFLNIGTMGVLSGSNHSHVGEKFQPYTSKFSL